MKRILRLALVALIALAGVLVGRALMLTRRSAPVPPLARGEVDTAKLADVLGEAIRCRTISADGLRDAEQFTALRGVLERRFPKVHETLKRETVGEGGLLFTWQGSDGALAPLVLLAHHDVVPVDPGSPSKWKHEPFSGALAEGFVWGRGALDDKGALVAQLFAIEHLLAEGKTPKRTVVLVSGDDEETNGEAAKAAVKLLTGRGVKPWMVLDEGMAIADGLVPGLKPRAALIGIAEKGMVTLELTVKGEGGHSSMPPAHTAAGILSEAIVRLEANPFPSRISEPTERFLDALAPEMPFGARVAAANRWLLGGLIRKSFEAKPSTAAQVRTTTAVTVLSAGVKENVLPQSAMAKANFRILPGDTQASVQARVKEILDDDRVLVSVSAQGLSSDPSPVSRTDSDGFAQLERTVRGVFTDVVVAPNLVLGGTDARHFAPICDQVYRFNPYPVQADDLARVHGTDERIGVETLADMVRFYRALAVPP